MLTYCLGVDLGTSYSAGAVASVESAHGAPRIERLEVGGDSRVPSTVVLADDGRIVAGSAAQASIGRAPERAERNPKRYVGHAPMLLGGRPVPAARAMAATLRLFVDEARLRFDGADPRELVLTHPVAWGSDRRGVLGEAAEEVLPETRVQLLDEPVAAAMHYAHERTLAPGQHVAVYDLGGGTFDAAVLTATKQGFRVVGRPGGDPEIGGESFDHAVFRHFGAQIAARVPEWWEQLATSSTRRWLAAAGSLLTEARIAKETLSQHGSAAAYVPDVDTDVRILRSEFDDLVSRDLRQTVDILRATVTSADVAPEQLAGVYLTGGASRIPLVRTLLEADRAGTLRTWKDPKTVVALGAARHGIVGAPPPPPPPPPLPPPWPRLPPPGLPREGAPPGLPD